jgi:hypothetical protein
MKIVRWSGNRHVTLIGKAENVKRVTNIERRCVVSEYMHTDDVADLIHAKEVEISNLKKQVSKLLMHLEYVRAEISRLETEHARGL